MMKESDIYRQLYLLLERLGIELREETLEHGQGGLCKFKDRRVIIVNKGLMLSEKIESICRGLRKVDLAAVHVAPALRQLISGKEEWKDK